MRPNRYTKLNYYLKSHQALFSMVFFDTKANENGSESIVVGRQWWLFPTITIPLTIVVLVTWVVWQRYRNRLDSESLGISDFMKVARPDPIMEKPFNETVRVQVIPDHYNYLGAPMNTRE